MSHRLSSASHRSYQLFWSCGRLSIGRTALSYNISSRARAGLSTSSDHGNTARRSSIAVTQSSRPVSKPKPIQPLATTFPRHYASSSTSSGPGIISTTEEHSPGHNIATLAVCNPTKLNIVNSSLLEDFIQKCDTLSKDNKLRAIVLTGAPTNEGKAKSWIGGADIKEMIAISSSQQAREFIDRVHRACEALRKIPVPVIAKIDGFCLGAGMEIAAACDLRVATKGSVFGMPEVKVGIPSVVEAAYLPGLIGMGRTRRLLYLAENIDAVKAERWGFVEETVDDETELDAIVNEWTGALVGMGPNAIRSQKVLMQSWENCGVEEGIEAGAKAYAEAYADGGKEPKEFMGKFVNRTR